MWEEIKVGGVLADVHMELNWENAHITTIQKCCNHSLHLQSGERPCSGSDSITAFMRHLSERWS
jgi:hypothetical protein